ncbi:adenylate/guanylate cyclase domain-containing protein [Variovorax sp. J22R133]|uniref:adenylate/guanylate cyclase domain-containing protein n=1 Tax=Variovorax brevis TaxID=3053503 RepID=UPI0025752293|nr:adenylate/guanylate cyclase domain-containing protein [Variovorax sp. J22R133]MDM0117770.1 adenylate/guanylate cyclase domain-containing protein [Variovorax sp. J22R133]
MQSVELRHRLLVILAADAAGYSRLMALDDIACLNALDSARRVFETYIKAYGGRLIDTAGDSVLAVFETASGAVSAAIAAQEEIATQSSDVPQDRRMLFRIGIHLGDVLEKGDGTVYGDGVNIAARLQTLAQPGGMTVSQAVHGAISHRLRTAFEDIGLQMIKNIATPVHAFRLLHAEQRPQHDVSAALDARRPMSATMPAAFAGQPASTRSTLPPPHPALLGREDDLAALEKLLTAHRLVTVVGAGGIGKTSLALWAGTTAQAAHPDGAAWVELGPISHPALLCATVARAVGLPVGRGDDPLPSLLAGLKTRRMLIVLDNAEHLLGAVAQLAEAVIRLTPGVRLLVTSQAALRCEDEHILRLGALAIPDSQTTPEVAAGFGAVALFVDGAKAANRTFALSEGNVDNVVAICRGLDGIPLALKLASARVSLFGLSGLASQLPERLRVLGGGNRNAPPRQQTLRAALDWSYGLLSATEQTVFKGLGIFVDGFTLALASAVTVDARGRAIDGSALVDALAELVDRSLVVVIDRGDLPRYQLLESAREYALDQLRAAGELHEAQHRHAKAILRRFQGGDESLWVTTDVAWLAACAAELGNLRAALEWSKYHDLTLVLALAGSSAHFFTMMGLMHEYRRRSAELADHLPSDVEPAVLAAFWLGRAQAMALSNYREMRVCAIKAADFHRQSASARGLYLSLCFWVMAGPTPPDEGRRVLDELSNLEDPHWPPRLLAYRQLATCTAMMYANDPVGMQFAGKAGLALAKLAGADRSAAVFECHIVRSDLTLGNVEGALSRARNLVAHEHRRGGLLNASLGYLAVALLIAGDLLQARVVIADFFDCCRSAEWDGFDDFAGIPIRLTLGEQRHTSAARLVGYRDKATHRLGRETPFGAALRAHALAAFEGHLDDATVQKLIAEGHQMREEDVCAVTLEAGN